jgi:hypothetical protein
MSAIGEPVGRTRASAPSAFNWALLGVSLLPAAVLLFNFEIANRQVAAGVFMVSALLYVSSTHTWITGAYYADKTWRAHFNAAPLRFYAAPVAILALSAGLSALSQPLALAVVYAAVTINLWHHSRQNWGVLSLTAKTRGVDVSPLRLPLTYAWVAFLPVFFTVWPAGHPLESLESTLRNVAMVTSGLYLCLFAWALARSGAWRDGFVLLFALALALYFVPMVTLADKPYGLILFKYAHAAQYYLLVIMSISLAQHTAQEPRATAFKALGVIATIAVISVIGWQVGVMGGGRGGGLPEEAVRGAAGLMMGVSLAHFWIDAFIWKMSNKDVRALHGAAFSR